MLLKSPIFALSMEVHCVVALVVAGTALSFERCAETVSSRVGCLRKHLVGASLAVLLLATLAFRTVMGPWGPGWRCILWVGNAFLAFHSLCYAELPRISHPLSRCLDSWPFRRSAFLPTFVC